MVLVSVTSDEIILSINDIYKGNKEGKSSMSDTFIIFVL